MKKEIEAAFKIAELELALLIAERVTGKLRRY